VGELGSPGVADDRAGRLALSGLDAYPEDLEQAGRDRSLSPHLKSNPETQAIRILGITGHPEVAPALLAAGADLVLTKPLVFDEVESYLSGIVEDR
jgi:CheY-like chemotaxis protein